MSQRNDLNFQIFNKKFFPEMDFQTYNFFFFYEETLKIDRNTDANGKRGISSSRNLSKVAFLSAVVRMKNTHPPWIQPW